LSAGVVDQAARAWAPTAYTDDPILSPDMVLTATLVSV
jgi:hypothetical protein